MKGISNKYKSVLTIAGSDSGGCAGIQADIKSISACGAYAASVITATTAQNTKGVFDIHPIPINHIEKQLDAVLTDIRFNSTKIGMLHSCEVMDLVQKKLKFYKIKNIVIDPVMVATSGDKLIDDSAVNCIKNLLSMALIITQNILEAEILIGSPISSDTILDVTKKIGNIYNTSVLLKGGHLESNSKEIMDVLYIKSIDDIVLVKNPRINSINTHGTGCSLSSSIAAFLSLGFNIEDSVIKACRYVNKAISKGSDMILGKGKGPINHFFLR